MASDLPCQPPEPARGEAHRRVLIIDDNRAIHEDFRKILSRGDSARALLDAAAVGLFGVSPRPVRRANFILESAFQGAEGARLAEAALAAGHPFAMAFVDMRMPPGMDGLETIARLWEIQADLQIVLCTAHSDYSLEEIQEQVEVSDRLLILKKPFDTVEVLQLAQALTEKWRLGRLAGAQAAGLTRLVAERTAELEAANTALREQARLINLVPDAVAVCDLADRVQFWNAGAEHLYGWKAEEVAGTSLSELVFTPHPQGADPKQKLLAKGEWRGELTHQTKGGREVIISSRWALIRDDLGEPKSILIISTDITEQKQLEKQFLRAQRMESIGTLASGVAHDLNNILAPILMCAPMLREEIKPVQREALVAAIVTSAERGAQIVRQVLAFGRGVEGARRLFDFSALLEEIVQITCGTFPKNIRISSNVAPDLARVCGDQTQWHQVLLNLAVNARDAMPEGGELHFQASNLEVDAHYAGMQPPLLPGDHLLLEVSDSGSGIPPALAERIFEPFFTTKALGQGTGLGLSTVAGIVKSHGGVIDLSSAPGRGTTFRVLIPVAPGIEAAPLEHSLASHPRGRGELVLLVDDEEGIRRIAQTVLERHGYRVLAAADGPEALALYAQHSATIGAVLTDITMPYMDGAALIRALRKMGIRTPIVASTGQGECVRLAELKSLEVAGILHKPYAAAALLSLLHEALHPTAEVPAQ